MGENDLQPIIDVMTEFLEDPSVPKNVKAKIQVIVTDLKSDSELSIKVNRSLQKLEEISEDANLQAFNRTQVWNIISLLESV
jgi:uncharacterized protein (UPF0147 family)